LISGFIVAKNSICSFGISLQKMKQTELMTGKISQGTFDAFMWNHFIEKKGDNNSRSREYFVE
jgi:hypothetical protein